MMSLAYNHLCHFQSDNVFQISVTLQGKTILLYTSDNFVENQRFDEKKKHNETDARRYPYVGSNMTY